MFFKMNYVKMKILLQKFFYQTVIELLFIQGLFVNLERFIRSSSLLPPSSLAFLLFCTLLLFSSKLSWLFWKNQRHFCYFLREDALYCVNICDTT